MAVELLVMVGFALFAALLVWRGSRRRRALEPWRSVAAECDLAYDDGGWLGAPRLEGTYRGVEVDVELERRDGENTEQVVVYRASLPPSASADRAASRLADLEEVDRSVELQDRGVEVVERVRRARVPDPREVLDLLVRTSDAVDDGATAGAADGAERERR